MNFSYIATNAISALLSPPLNLVLLCMVGLLLCRSRPRAGLAVSFAALLILLVISTPAGSLLLVAPLEKLSVPLTPNRATDAQAIVVLGGGRMSNQPEYQGRDTPAPLALVRLRYAAQLQRQTGLPILVTGGAPDGSRESEAELMARVLTQDFRAQVAWIEDRSINTAENAQLSADKLRAAGVRRILLVTDAIHMPRSQRIFEKAGFEVRAAPTHFYTRERLTPLSFLPGGPGLHRSHYAMHEWIGMLWYELRH